MVELAKEQVSISELAKQELVKEDVKEAVKELKVLYKKKLAAEKIVRNINREIADYEEELDA